MRVIILAAELPLVLALTGVAPSPSPAATMTVASPLELGELVAASLALALLLRLLRFPASWMFGAMIASSVLHGEAWVVGGLPPWLRTLPLPAIVAFLANRFARP